MFWDQSVRDKVEQIYPYNTNTQTVTANADDKVFLVEAPTSDPVFKYVQLGDDIQDGFLAWIVLAVNTTLSNTVSPAAVLYASGGVEEAWNLLWLLNLHCVKKMKVFGDTPISTGPLIPTKLPIRAMWP
jgi:hypothetical protein